MDHEEIFGRGELNERIDATELADRIGLDESEIDQRKAFVGFDGEDERRLRDLEPLLRASQDRIAEDFYEHVMEFEETRAVLDRSPRDGDALKRTQRAYLVSLATGSYDRDFFANRARIGKLHELLDMPLKYYIGQYSVYYESLLDRLSERVQREVVDAIETWAANRDDDEADGTLEAILTALGLGPGDRSRERQGIGDSLEEAVRTAIDDGMNDALSLLRLLTLDQQIVTETYVDSDARRLERAIDRRERLAREVEEDVEAPIEELHQASEQIASRAEAISQHTATQAADTNQAAAELGDLSAAIEEIASVTDDVRETSELTERLTAEGVSAADEALDDLEAIEAAADDISRSVADLEDGMEAIDDTLDRLDDVVERTTLLAKNAQIEAARLDDSVDGRPMSVIAEEVASFATQTKRDIDAIERAVEGVRDDAANTIETAERTVARIDDGTARVRETMDSLETIHDSARATAMKMEDVAAATDQQARSVQTTVTTVERIAETADEVAGAAESVAAASQEQTASLREVGETVSRLTDEGSHRPTPTPERVG